MATFDIITKPAAARGVQVAGIASNASTAAQLVGVNSIIEITATQPVKIAFGAAAMGAADATDYLIPANTPKRFEFGNDFTHFRVFNAGASAADLHYIRLTRN